MTAGIFWDISLADFAARATGVLTTLRLEIEF
jgi:hypothetical protein